jgi:hypothetical protein
MSTKVLVRIVVLAGVVALAGCASSSGGGSSGSAAASPPAAAKPARTAAQIKMDELLDNPKAKAVLAKHAPALAANDQINMARGMSLADVAGYAQSGLTPEIVNAIVADINKL